MTLLSFDINASRVRAVQGSTAEMPGTFALDPPRAEMPLVVSMAGGRPEIGMPGILLMHERPDLVYRQFLPFLGKDDPWKKFWRPRSHALDAEQALELALLRLKKISGRDRDIVISIPPYLEQEQKSLLFQAAEQVGFVPHATVVNSLALGLAAHAENPWTGSVLAVDVDEHALWVSLLQEADGWARLVETFLYPKLNLQRWKQRLLDALADCCILQSRRDPRDFPAAEQSLYMQLDEIMENCVQNRAANVTFQTANWFQHLVLQPEDIESFCTILVRPLVNDIQGFFQSVWPEQPPSAILLSAQAASLPGLAVSLEDFLDRWLNFSRGDAPALTDPNDFGAHLLEETEELEAGPQVVILSVDAAARGAHLVAGDIIKGKIAAGHLNESAPLPEPQPPDAGPARLHFQGRDYLLRERPFTLGRRYDCDLVLDQNRYPSVSPWHCEIIYDPRRYFLKDLSREGTWLNDQPVTQVTVLKPGDRIRLGPNGPVVRYLGQPESRGLTTIA